MNTNRDADSDSDAHADIDTDTDAHQEATSARSQEGTIDVVYADDGHVTQ